MQRRLAFYPALAIALAGAMNYNILAIEVG